jgi:hypothetical protein
MKAKDRLKNEKIKKLKKERIFEDCRNEKRNKKLNVGNVHKMTCIDKSVVFPGPTVSSSNKADRPDIAEILLKVALNTTTQPKAGW